MYVQLLNFSAKSWNYLTKKNSSPLLEKAISSKKKSRAYCKADNTLLEVNKIRLNIFILLSIYFCTCFFYEVHNNISHPLAFWLNSFFSLCHTYRCAEWTQYENYIYCWNNYATMWNVNTHHLDNHHFPFSSVTFPNSYFLTMRKTSPFFSSQYPPLLTLHLRIFLTLIYHLAITKRQIIGWNTTISTLSKTNIPTLLPRWMCDGQVNYHFSPLNNYETKRKKYMMDMCYYAGTIIDSKPFRAPVNMKEFSIAYH